MNTENERKLDPLKVQMLLNDMRKEAAARRSAYKPHPRIRHPWLGTLNWERHKHKRAKKRYFANKVARQTRKAQRRAARA